MSVVNAARAQRGDGLDLPVKKITKPRKRKTPTRDELDAMGEDRIFGLLCDGQTDGEIAKVAGVSRSLLNQWLHANAGRSARARVSSVLG